MADVFISYSRKDRKAAESVAARIEREGWSAWWDKSLSAGERWDETIRTELARARCVLVLWSHASWNSKWVQAEAHEGFGRDALVSARLDDIHIEPPFSIVQASDLRGRAGKDGLEALVQGLRLKLGPATRGTPVAQDEASWTLPPLQGQEFKVKVVWQPTGYVLVRADDGTLVKDRRNLAQDELTKVPPEPCLFVNLHPNRGGLESCIITEPHSDVYGSMRAFWWSLARGCVLNTSALLYGAGIRGEQLAFVSVAAQTMWQSAVERHPVEEMRDLMIATRNIHLTVISELKSKEQDPDMRLGLQIALAMVLATQSEDRKLEGAAYKRFKKFLWAPGDEPPEFAEHDHIT